MRQMHEHANAASRVSGWRRAVAGPLGGTEMRNEDEQLLPVDQLEAFDQARGAVAEQRCTAEACGWEVIRGRPGRRRRAGCWRRGSREGCCGLPGRLRWSSR